jgi:hypothetical protein
MYKHILKMEVAKTDQGLQYWLSRLAAGVPRSDIEQYFRQVAFKENQQSQQQQVDFGHFLDAKDKGRVIVVIPESAGDVFLVTSLFKSIKDRYPEWSLYVATKTDFKDILAGNPYVHKWLEYNPMMDNLAWLEGASAHNGYFDIAYLPHSVTQRFICYRHNGVDKMDYVTTL